MHKKQHTVYYTTTISITEIGYIAHRPRTHHDANFFAKRRHLEIQKRRFEYIMHTRTHYSNHTPSAFASPPIHSTVTDFARFLGWSTSSFLSVAME